MTSNLDVAGVVEAPADPAANAMAMVGHHYRVEDYYEVSREKVREYARAVQDYHPVHWDEDTALEFGYDNLVAPLTFISLVGILAQRKLFEQIVTGYALSQIMQTDQVLEFHQPIKVGDQLSCEVYLHSFRQAFGGDLITTKNLVYNQHDEVVMTTYTGLIGRSGGEADPDIERILQDVFMHGLGVDAPAHHPRSLVFDAPMPAHVVAPSVVANRRARRFESVSVGDELPRRVVKLTRGDLVNYAGVSGDGNPIHFSDEVAKIAGLDNVIAHGMCTMGLGAGFITSWLGDPGAVKDYNVRFTSPVFVPPDRPGEIEYTGRVKSIDETDKTAVVAIVAKHAGKKIFGRATATIQLV